MSAYVKFDSEASLREARARMPLSSVIEQSGHGPRNGKWKSFTCPFCNKKNKAGIFEHEGVELFKCQSTSCQTGARAMDAVGYIQYIHGRSRADAFVDYLKMAGVWKDRARFQDRTLPDQPAPTAEPASPAVASETASPPSGLLPSAEAVPPAGEAPSVPASSPVIPDNSAPVADPLLAAAEANADASAQLDAERQATVETPPQVAAPVTVNEDEEPTEERCREALCEFYAQLSINERDETELFKKRAIPSRITARLGFKSNVKANREILWSLRARFPMSILLASGLWKKDEHGARPEAQFHGYGRTVATAKNEADEVKEWDWTEPILIPYFNSDGELFHIRPHKGGIKGHAGHLYVPRAAGEICATHCDHALITEGEFKIASVLARFPAGWGGAALPGIQMFRNYSLWEELEAWLSNIRARHIVVVYDNEEKGDPMLAGYKEDKGKRYDSHIWARVLATQLHKRLHLRAEIAVLPKEMRDKRGKADWDGVMSSLAAEVHE